MDVTSKYKEHSFPSFWQIAFEAEKECMDGYNSTIHEGGMKNLYNR